MKIVFLSTIILLSSLLTFSQDIQRAPGKWTSIPLTPGVGRITDIVFDPNNGDRMYAAPDANGIWYTENQGRHWECITDNIPELEARISDNVIMVDPDDFNMLYYVSKYGHYYTTSNRGTDWTRVLDQNGVPLFLTDFKRSILARDQESGKLIMACTTIGKDHGKKSITWEKGLHISQDKGQTWIHYPNPSPEEQYLEIAFHPTNAKIIYAPTSHRLFKSMDGGLTFENSLDFVKPFGNFSSITTISSNPDWVYLITFSKPDKTIKKDTPKSALYLSKDAGLTWETIQNMDQGIGFESSVYGPGFVGSWLHCFAVNPSNPDEMITAHNVMAETNDGGKTWKSIPWNLRVQARMDDGSLHLNKYGKHIADNHVIKFHPKHKSRAYKACDSGLYMRDPDIGFDQWVEITGDMLAMLFYSVKVNEFGDRYIAGNTQDCDIQSFQYGAWQWVRGYEGDVVFIHPYTNSAYFPYCGCGDGTEIKGLFDKGSITSWGRPQIAPNYRNPDESVILYQTKNIKTDKKQKQAFHIKDRGLSADTLAMPCDGDIYYFNISRTAEQRFTAISADTIALSCDKGISWESKATPVVDITFGAVDPDNPDRIWIGSKKGKIFESADAGDSWTSISDGLTNSSILKLLYHEGSARDLYALVVEGDGQFMRPKGVYTLNNTTNQWERWMEGYALNGFSDIIIDYPSQKLLASSYGRGIWEADLLASYERFLGGDIEIAQINGSKKAMAFKIATPYHLPDYYNFSWSVNGQRVNNNSMYLLDKEIKKGDLISCQLSPRYSSDIVLKTLPLQAKKLKVKKVNKENRVIRTDGAYLDLGYYDYFAANTDFNIEIKVKPEGDGVLLANRRLTDHDAKGWLMQIQNDSLVVNYSARYNTAGGGTIRSKGLPKTAEQMRFPIRSNEWNTIQLSFSKQGKVKAFLDGELMAEKSLAADEIGVSFNSVFNLHLCADALGTSPLSAEIDDLRIWRNEDKVLLHHAFDTEDTGNLFDSSTQTKAKVVGSIESLRK